MKPLISYYGGKQKMASKIIPHIPKHTVYVEPYCGGASILFAKPWPKVTNNNNYREVINDTSDLLINMYRVFQTRFEEIEHLLMNTLCSKAEHAKAVGICKGVLPACDLWKAWAYYVNIQTSFTKKLNAGWGRSVFGRSQAATWISKLSGLNEYRDRMSGVHIEKDDAIKCIKRWDSPQTFFYCDPPYPGTVQGHYKGFTEDDLSALIKTLEVISGSAILSNYNTSITMPETWKKFEFSAIASSSGKGKIGQDRSDFSKKDLGDRKRTEVIWVKQSIPPRPEIQKLYDSGSFDCFTG